MHRRDFSSSNRLLLLSAFAVVIGGLSTLGAWLLLAMIRFFTNLFFYQTLSLAHSSPADNQLGAWVILVPVPDVQARYFGIDQKQRAYPVIDGDRLLGVVERGDLPPAVVQDAGQPVAELLQGIPITYALANETCRAVASRMAALGLERLPAVESPGSLKVIGVVSRSDLLKPAQQLHEEESRRERFLRR